MEMPINAAIIQNGIVTNIIWILKEQVIEFGAIPITTNKVGIGWLYQDSQFIDPNPMVNDILIEEIPIEW